MKKLKCEKCEYVSRSEKTFKTHADAHRKMEKFLGDLHVESRMLLENIPEAEIVFTVEEITTFGLDWKQIERILEIAKEAYW